MARDPGYNPNWKRKTIVRAPKEDKRKLSFHVYGLFESYLGRAANRRGMSHSAYMRRAIGAFIAYDLQIPWEEMASTFPAVVYDPTKTTYSDGLVVSQRDDGKGYGQWEIQSLF